MSGVTINSFESLLRDAIEKSGWVEEGTTEAPILEEPDPILEVKSAEVVLGSYQKMFSELFFKPTLADDFPLDTYHHLKDEWWGIYVPEVNAHFTPDKEAMECIARAFSAGDKIYVSGPPGSGKTTSFEYFAAITGRPFFRFNFNLETDKSDLFGHYGLTTEDGATVTKFFETLGTKIWRDSPAVFLLDEITKASAASLMLLQRPLESNDKTIAITEKGEEALIKANPGLLICAADNTKGLGDGMDKYGASNMLDISTLDRFEMYLEMKYLTVAEEKKLLTSAYPDLPMETANSLCQFAKLVRTAFLEGKLPIPLSTRRMLPIAKYTLMFKNPLRAIKLVYLNNLAEDAEKAAVAGFGRTVWSNYDTLGGLE